MAATGLLRLVVASIAAAQAAALLPLGPWVELGPRSDPADAAHASSVPHAADTFEPHSLSVPVDHFHNESKYEPHSNASFGLRYWFDAAHYEEGGPVIVLHSGESSGDERLPYLEYGILSILARATHGIGVVLEHRYYGASNPTPAKTVEDLRFLSTEQTLADNAYFARHVHFPVAGHANVTSSSAPFIIYGGSYAGSVAGLTRKLYPDAYWGAISSSGVPAAIDDYWQYLEAARYYAPGDCSPTLQKLTDVVDNMLLGGDRSKADEIKHLFGLEALLDDEFASVISRGIMGLQSTNWDPDEDSAEYGFFCAAISSDAPLFASTAHLAPAVRRAVVDAGYDDEEDHLVPRMLNYIGYVKQQTRLDKAQRCRNSSLRQCYSMRLRSNSMVQVAGGFRSWIYQTCTQ